MIVVDASALVVGLTGCASAHDSDAVLAGIYELTVERGTEACAPARALSCTSACVPEGLPADLPTPVRCMH